MNNITIENKILNFIKSYYDINKKTKSKNYF